MSPKKAFLVKVNQKADADGPWGDEADAQAAADTQIIGPRGPDQNGAQRVISGCRRCPTPIGGKSCQILSKNPCRTNVGINMFGI